MEFLIFKNYDSSYREQESCFAHIAKFSMKKLENASRHGDCVYSSFFLTPSPVGWSFSNVSSCCNSLPSFETGGPTRVRGGGVIPANGSLPARRFSKIARTSALSGFSV